MDIMRLRQAATQLLQKPTKDSGKKFQPYTSKNKLFSTIDYTKACKNRFRVYGILSVISSKFNFFYYLLLPLDGHATSRKFFLQVATY